MKNTRSAIAVTLLFAGVTAFVLQIQKAQSNPPPPPPAPAFEDHYDQKNFTIDAAVNDENGAHPGTRTLPFPVFDRAVRISLTFRADDGQNCFAEEVAYYKTSTGEFAIYSRGGSQAGINFPMMVLPPEEAGPGVGIFGNGDGTVTFENFHTAGGTVHIALWF